VEEYLVEKYGNRVRVRVCGVLIERNRILLVKHVGLGNGAVFWAPPGGEVEYGISVKENLQREMLEETGLKVKVGKFLNVHEFINPPLHAVELYFKIDEAQGEVIKGIDPELKTSEQIIEEVRFVTFEELEIIPNKQKHQVLQNICRIEELFDLPPFF